ncbi:hypothetical protein BC939DRAFT_471674 [Gamsiella multidivaricata]|uniref:uncharacterized protein n=1 Tax=Gamsiella multidivaricata TaxID=101098 RepID=UPI00221F7524|nr:uncharacterized protein BC939DRAFT_471674 [Gamsiella multidivaricata]KAI7815788.1 hypothetical protein BC939DRAFT_471674 [Gamsiella multidivaricata]
MFTNSSSAIRWYWSCSELFVFVTVRAAIIARAVAVPIVGMATTVIISVTAVTNAVVTIVVMTVVPTVAVSTAVTATIITGRTTLVVELATGMLLVTSSSTVKDRQVSGEGYGDKR